MRLLFLMLLWLAPASAAWAEEFLFIGLHDMPAAGKNSVCWDNAMDTQPLKSEAEYRAASKEYYNFHKGQSPFTKLLTPDMAAVVFKYRAFKSAWNCEHDAYSIQTGHDVAAAKESMEMLRREKPKAFRSDPEVVFTWPGSEYKSVVQRNYDGVEVTYTTRRSGGKTVVFAKGRNTNRDKAAFVSFSGKGVKTNGQIVLKPGEGFSQTLGAVGVLGVEVGLVEHIEDSKDRVNEAIDYVKGKVRDHVTIKDGGLKPDGDLTVWGVRG